jgi:hypothetical protein
MRPNPMRFSHVAAILVGTLLGGCAELEVGPGTAGEESPITVAAVSTHADRVSGGDVLIEVVLPDELVHEFGANVGPADETATAPFEILLDGRDVSGVFRPAGEPGRYLGLVTGLEPGANRVLVPGEKWGVSDAQLEVTNHPMTGPIVSGPHIEPFICQTGEFTLPDGTLLGPPLDENCSVETRVQHIYRSDIEDAFLPLPEGGALPADLALTTTVDGVEVPFIVRVETGTMNRGIYQNAVLHNPLTDPDPSPFDPPPAWNSRLIAVHGVGCPTGWYRQGGAMGVNLFGGVNVARLGEGYAIFTNSLNHPTNSCNAFLAGESTMMGKEHFIETFGPPSFTVSIGASGGAYTGLQVADAFPGLIDGVIATSTFPDALSIALAGLDARLLMRDFHLTEPGRFSDEQQVAITGYFSVRAFEDAANQAQRTDPVAGREDLPGYNPARWHAVIPEALHYHPETNPTGARPTVFDVGRNLYGIDPETGFALRPFDNVGVQYGLDALNTGAITPTDFLDLNERVGGYDHDSNFTPERSSGDPGAIRRAYQGGLTLGGGGGLADIPVFDAGGYNEATSYHYQWFHFAVRERMRNENGHADNHLMWRGDVPAEERWNVMIEWLEAIRSDDSPGPQIDKVLANRPQQAVDGCWIASGEETPAHFVAEHQTFSSTPDSACNEQFPSYSFTRMAAGGGLDGNVLKCALTEPARGDYQVEFSDAEWERFEQVFPEGVCDWSVPGVEQQSVVPWASFGPTHGNLVYEVTLP